MNILALESSSLVGSVAIIKDDILIGEYTTNLKKTHSQTLLPMLDQLTQMLSVDLNDLDAIAVASGPGSFTGLRIGSSTAKGLGLALKKPVISVPTLTAMAYNHYHSDALICPMMDARRGQVYTGLYQFKDGELKILKDQQAISIIDWIERVNQVSQKVVFLGDGIEVNREYINKHMYREYTFAAPHLRFQKASSVAMLAMEMFKNGQVESAADHVPNYLRMPQAERELLERIKGK